MHFYDRWRLMCEEKGVTEPQAYKEMQINKGTVSTWRTAKANGIDIKPSTKIAVKIAEYFDKTTDFVLYGECKKPSLELGEPIGAITGIPIIASVKAGYNGLAIEEDTGEFVHIPSIMLKGYPESECKAMRVRGDSMYPNMHDGDIVVVHIQPVVENGKVAVCIVNGDEGTIKRFFRYSDRVELWPDNSQVPKMILRGQSLESFHIYGRAIALIREDL